LACQLLNWHAYGLFFHVGLLLFIFLGGEFENIKHHVMHHSLLLSQICYSLHLSLTVIVQDTLTTVILLEEALVMSANNETVVDTHWCLFRAKI
jgi:hypothetical protein